MLTCPNCSNAIDSKTLFCPYCDAPVEDYVNAASSGGDTAVAASVATGRRPIVNRYLDLYRAARLLIGVGTTVKAIGIIIGIGIFLLCLFAGFSGSTQTNTFGPQQSSTNTGFLFGTFVVGAVFGTFVGGVIFLLGILISAQGQILLAQADCAIHTSPFMTEEEKARAMSVPYQSDKGRLKDLSSVSNEDIAAELAARGISSPA